MEVKDMEGRINELKITIFDILRKQAQLQEEIKTLEQTKITLLAELKKLEEKAREKKNK